MFKKASLLTALLVFLSFGVTQLTAATGGTVNCLISCDTWLEICLDHCSDWACVAECRVGYKQCLEICGS